MKKEKGKKKSKKILFILILLIIILILFFYLKELKIKNIYIKNNKYLTDQEIIELANIENYPRIFSISSNKLKNKIKLNSLVKDVKIKKNILGKITIYIEEYNPLIKNEIDNTIYLSNNKTISKDIEILGLPSLTNVVPKEILNSFIKKINEIDRSILNKISEITYSPNEYDQDLFLLFMNDGNYVYVTTTKLLNINKYNQVVIKLGGKKGILYLDSGNHFEILE